MAYYLIRGKSHHASGMSFFIDKYIIYKYFSRKTSETQMCHWYGILVLISYMHAATPLSYLRSVVPFDSPIDLAPCCCEYLMTPCTYMHFAVQFGRLRRRHSLVEYIRIHTCLTRSKRGAAFNEHCAR